MTPTQDANSAHPAEICALAERMVLLQGLVARAAQDEHERLQRMNARPAGTHSPARLAQVARNSADLAAIEAAIKAVIDRRNLGENDPGRYEIQILVGPCSLDEATAAMDTARDALLALPNDLGPAASLTTWDEEAETIGA